MRASEWRADGRVEGSGEAEMVDGFPVEIDTPKMEYFLLLLLLFLLLFLCQGGLQVHTLFEGLSLFHRNGAFDKQAYLRKINEEC